MKLHWDAIFFAFIELAILANLVVLDIALFTGQHTPPVAVGEAKAVPSPEGCNEACIATINKSVTKGDSLWKIAVAQYGTGYAWTRVYNANRKLIGKNRSEEH